MHFKLAYNRVLVILGPPCFFSGTKDASNFKKSPWNVICIINLPYEISRHFVLSLLDNKLSNYNLLQVTRWVPSTRLGSTCYWIKSLSVTPYKLWPVTTATRALRSGSKFKGTKRRKTTWTVPEDGKEGTGRWKVRCRRLRRLTMRWTAEGEPMVVPCK